MASDQFQVFELITTSSKAVISDLVQLHKDIIRDGFLVKLDSVILYNLYEIAVESPNAHIFVGVKNDRVHGFIMGSSSTRKLYKDFILHRGLKILFCLSRSQISLAKIYRIFETLIYPFKKPKKKYPTAEILNFCVLPESQGCGLGKLLFARISDCFHENGFDSIKIVTGASQKSGHYFYRSIGANQMDTLEVHRGEKSFVFLYQRP